LGIKDENIFQFLDKYDEQAALLKMKQIENKLQQMQDDLTKWYENFVQHLKFLLFRQIFKYLRD